jgi:hypothetical protein
MRLAHVRQLSAPSEDDEDLPPPSPSAGETMLAAIRELIEVGRQQVVEAGL